MLSKHSGKRAARFVLDQHPELFNKNLIEMQPEIKPFLPKLKITKKNATTGLLKTLVHACNVMDAKEAYEILTKEKNVKLDNELEQEYLELLCFHNSDEEELGEDALDVYGLLQPETKRWATGCAADNLAAEIINREGAKSEAAHRARLAIMLGKAKFSDFHGVTQTYDEIIANGGKLDTNAYNALLHAKGHLPDMSWTEIQHVLQTMAGQGVRPNRETLLRILQGLTILSASPGTLNLAIGTLAEFKALNIAPSLGCYAQLLKIIASLQKKEILIDILKELTEVQKIKGTLQLEIASEECYTFFPQAMFLAKAFPLSVSYQIHELLQADPNAELLLAGHENSNSYYNNYTGSVFKGETLEVFMDYWNTITPHIYIPSKRHYTEVIKRVQTEMAPQFMPKLWMDLKDLKFFSLGQDYRAELLAVVSSATNGLSSAVPESLKSAFGKIGEEIFQTLESSAMTATKRNRSWTTAHDSTIFNHCLEICLENGNISGAKKIVSFCQDQYSVMPDSLNGDVMKRFVTVMTEEEMVNDAYGGVIFMKELKHLKEAEEMALQVGQRLPLDQMQRQAFNNSFASSSKWVML